MYKFISEPDKDNPHDNARIIFETNEIGTFEIMDLFADFMVACGHARENVDRVLDSQ